MTKPRSQAGPDDTLPADPASAATISVAPPLDSGPGATQGDETLPASVEEREVAPPGEELLTAEHPERYRIEATLGEGGIGVVHLAYDRHLDREVALKELRKHKPSPSSTGSLTSAEARFLLEARVTGRLEHSAIVPVHEVGQRKDGSIYYTMRRVRGRTLGEALAGRDLRGRLELLPNLLDLCYAIAYAHSRGVIHRDLKPDNVLLGEFGDTILLDWGLAKVRGSGEVSQNLRALASSVSAGDVEGAPVGTPSYMPPEQARGEHAVVDERSDIFSLGAILYELLTGRPPFRGGTAAETVKQARTAPVTPPLELEPACPEELSAIALRALERDRERRYPDARMLAADLLAFQTGGLVSAHRYGAARLLWRWVRRHRRSLALAAVLLVASGAAWWYRGVADERARARVEARRQEGVRQLVEAILSRAVVEAQDRRSFESYAFRLIGLREPLVEERLIAAVRDERPLVRRLAARALGGIASRRAVPALCEQLAAEPTQSVIVELVNALGNIGDPRAETPVAAARHRAGVGSPIWRNTRLAYELIPLPPPAVGEEGSSEAWQRRGRAYEEKGSPRAALEAYDRALGLDPRAWRGLQSRAEVRKGLGDLAGALADLDRAISLAGGDPSPTFLRALLRRRLGDLKGARADADQVVAAGKLGAAALQLRASLRQAAGDRAGALADLERALVVDPRNARTHGALGKHWVKLEAWEKALACFDRALALDPDDVESLLERATIYQTQRNHSAALDDLDRVLAIDPSDRSARQQRANLRLQIGHRNGARRDLERSLADNPREALRWAQRGVTYHAQLGELAKAAADLDEALRRAEVPERLALRLAALGVAVLRGHAESEREHQAAIASLVARGRREEQLQAILGGKLGEPEARALARGTGLLEHRCALLFAAALRAQLAGAQGRAASLYAAAVAVPRPNALEHILARLLGARVAAE